MPDVVRFPPPSDVETLTIQVRLRDAEGYPLVTLGTDGKRTVDELDPGELASAIGFALISLGNTQKGWGEQNVPVAICHVYRSGKVNVMAETAEFTVPARRRWLDRCIDIAKAEFAALFASADRESLNAEHDDDGGGSR